VKKTICLLLLNLFIGGLSLNAQNADVENAHESFKIFEYAKAKKQIDLAFKDQNLKKDPYATFIRARIYQKLYLDDINHKDAAFLRAEAMTSYLDCKKFNDDSVRAAIINDQMIYLANSYYDESLTKLDTIFYMDAIDAYDQFILIMRNVDSSKITKSKVMDFHTKLAEIFEVLYNNNPTRQDILDLSKVSYLRVLMEDEKNPKINYLMGKVYLNEGLKLQNTDKDSSKAIEVWSQGLAFMQSAYHFAPKNIDVINALAQFYTLMKEAQKASDFKLIAEQVLKSGNSVKFK
jgi:hypothetical protein